MAEKSKPKSPSKPKKKLGKRYGSYGGYKGVNVKTAEKLVDSQIHKSVSKIAKDKKQANRDYVSSVRGIKKISNETQKFIGKNNRDSMAGYDEASKSLDSNNSALQSTLASRSNTIKSSASDELARLGIQDSSAFNSLDSNTQNALNVASITGNNDKANLAAQEAGARSIGDLMLGMNRGIRDSGIVSAQNDRRDAISEINDAIAEARGTRPDLLLQTLEQLRQTGWGQYMDSQNLAIQRRQMALQEQSARAAAGGSGGGGGGGGHGGHGGGGGGSSSTAYSPALDFLTGNVNPGKKPSKKHPYGWGQGLGVLSNKPPKTPKKKPPNYGKGLGVSTKNNALINLIYK